MRNILILLLIFVVNVSNAQVDIKKYFKFATFYGAVNGGTSISDEDIFSVSKGLETSILETPFDYNLAFGIRKIARFG